MYNEDRSFRASKSATDHQPQPKPQQFPKLHPPKWLLPVWDDVTEKYVIRDVSADEITQKLYRISNCSKFIVKNVGYKYSRVEKPEYPEFLNSGWTKVVHKFINADGKVVALKSFNSAGNDVMICYQKSKNNTKRYHQNSFFNNMVFSAKPSDDNGNSSNNINNNINNNTDTQFDGDDEDDDDETSHENVEMMMRCMKTVKWKLYKEAYIMHIMDHHSVAKLEDLCITNFNNFTSAPSSSPPSSSSSALIYSTKLGEEVTLIKLLQLSWEDRLKICYGVTKLLNYFHQSNNAFRRTILINDFRREQFVIVNNDVIISDLDDFTFEGQTCLKDEDCFVRGHNFSIACHEGTCLNWADTKNILDAGSHFINILLLPGSPTRMKQLASEIVQKFQNPVNASSPQLLSMMENLVKVYSGGLYLTRNVSNDGDVHLSKTNRNAGRYRVKPGYDLPGHHDYQCSFTRNMIGCTLTVHDVIEAEEMCEAEKDCVAFVLSPLRSWTDRRYVHLKNNITKETLKKVSGGYLTYFKNHIHI
ncbi:hypothetical protein HELRODRAFT_193594 [Helobdella robusta]|uniref:Protein kinase domain-containing protein n=1 Tax=Helobdella robusta TaxID=6412 RepID=T1FV55_HELRO|nr:hypothetical protein HELRODRAFT_193594 [Helobdella robusta]ESN95229.1 hypothetical protein HELRODRAFT_193594 [Helobdella robusta]